MSLQRTVQETVVTDVRRWGPVDRATHWLLMSGVLLGILTSLPLFFEQYGLFYQIYTVWGRGLLHRIGAILLVGAALIHLSYRMATFNKITESKMILRIHDLKDFLAIILHWFGLRKEYPKIGFHHPGEKFIYWVTAVMGLSILGISGMILWFPETKGPILGLLSIIGVTRLIPGIDTHFYAWVFIAHDIGFVIVTITIVGHFLMSINPVNGAALKAMFTHGRVPKSWVEAHHPGWKLESKRTTEQVQKLKEKVKTMTPTSEKVVGAGARIFAFGAIAIRVLLTIILVALIAMLFLG